MPFPKRVIPLTWLTGIFLANLALRLPTAGHFLTWDEAWILSALKDFFSVNQPGSLQLWKHPPIYLSLGLLLMPTKPGFELRMQLLSLIINSGALVFFTILFAKLYGRRIALLAAFIYILLPGTLFFDTWIKRDGLVTLFCALTLLSLVNKRDVMAGVFCGLSFLSKETAVFFVLGYFVFILAHRSVSEFRRSLILFGGSAIITSSWWYFFFYPFADAYLAFYQGISLEATGFIKPWWFYFSTLRIDLGWLVLPLFITGFLALIPVSSLKNRTKPALAELKRSRFLPLFMLAPGYIILSLSKAKPPWMTLSFAPFWALLSALGWLFLFKYFSRVANQIYRKGIYNNNWVAMLLLVGLLLANSLPFNYLGHFKKLSPDLAAMTIATYEIRDVINKNVKKNEKLLILPMIYRTAPTTDDPILYDDLKSIETLYYKKSNWSFSGFQKTIRHYKIKWVLIFPIPGSWQEELFKRIIQEMDPSGYEITAGYLLKVDADQP